MQHVISEFSPENMLCVTELTQFQEYMCKKHGIEDHKTRLQLPTKDDAFPRSTIVYNEDDAITDWHRCMQLIEKYLLNSSEFQVNVSWSIASAFRNLHATSNRNALQRMTPRELVQFFNSFVKYLH